MTISSFYLFEINRWGVFRNLAQKCEMIVMLGKTASKVPIISVSLHRAEHLHMCVRSARRAAACVPAYGARLAAAVAPP